MKNIEFLSQYQCQRRWLLIKFYVWFVYLKMQKLCSLTQMSVSYTLLMHAVISNLQQTRAEKTLSLLLLNISAIVNILN